MAKDPKNFTGENMRALLEASRHDEELRQGNKLVGHFALVAILGIAVVLALVFGLVQIFSR